VRVLLTPSRGAHGQQRRTRMSRARRNPAPGFTAPVALAAIMGDQTLAERAEACEGHPNQISGRNRKCGSQRSWCSAAPRTPRRRWSRTSRCCPPRSDRAHWSMMVEKRRSPRRACCAQCDDRPTPPLPLVRGNGRYWPWCARRPPTNPRRCRQRTGPSCAGSTSAIWSVRLPAHAG
jgi:hypothetical protein